MSAPGVAAGYAFQPQPPAPPGPVFVDCLNGVLRTGRGIPTGIRKIRGYNGLIYFYKSDQNCSHHTRINSKTPKIFPAIRIFADISLFYAAIHYLGG